MPSRTQNYNLIKPAQDESYDVDQFNTNFDAIDAQLKANADAANTAQNKANDHHHGNITNDGKVGTEANKAVYTGNGGALQAGTLPVAAGGTGGTTAAEARTGIGAAAASQAKTASLTVEGWEEDAANEVWTQTVNVTGVTASNNIISSPAPDYIEDASECGVYCYAQQNGSLIFVASSQPSRVVIMNVLIVG